MGSLITWAFIFPGTPYSFSTLQQYTRIMLMLLLLREYLFTEPADDDDDDIDTGNDKQQKKLRPTSVGIPPEWRPYGNAAIEAVCNVLVLTISRSLFRSVALDVNSFAEAQSQLTLIFSTSAVYFHFYLSSFFEQGLPGWT